MKKILHKCNPQYTEAPKFLPSYMGTDAPILGNGSMLSAFGNWEVSPEFYITSNDFWRMKNTGKLGYCDPRTSARLVFNYDEKPVNSVVYQDLYTAKTFLTIYFNKSILEMTSYIDANENLLVCKFTSKGGKAKITANFEDFLVNMVAPYDTFLATGKISNEIECVIADTWQPYMKSLAIYDGQTLIHSFDTNDYKTASNERKAMPWNEMLRKGAIYTTVRHDFKELNLKCTFNFDSLSEKPENIENCIIFSTGFWAVCGGYTNGFFSNVSFSKLRAFGGFELSGVLEEGDVIELIITSIHGNSLSIKNPWKCAELTNTKSGYIFKTKEDIITVTTNKRDTFILHPINS